MKPGGWLIEGQCWLSRFGLLLNVMCLCKTW